MTSDTYQAVAVQVVRNLMATIDNMDMYPDGAFDEHERAELDALNESIAAGKQFVEEIID